MLMPVTQAMIEAALSKIREADYDVPYAVVSVALEAAERARWQPIETAPKDATCVLLYDGDGTDPTVCFWHAIQGWTVRWDHEPFEAPTHWQPLPSPPESK